MQSLFTTPPPIFFLGRNPYFHKEGAKDQYECLSYVRKSPIGDVLHHMLPIQKDKHYHLQRTLT